MIREVTIKNFKRFGEVKFELRGHIVLAGPNNTGKTTFLQAISAAGFAFNQWKTLNRFNKSGRGPSYAWKPIARPSFTSVPLRSFDLLWSNREYRMPIEISILWHDGRKLELEIQPDTTEQVKVRPTTANDGEMLRNLDFDTTFIPPMSGLETEEPVYTRPKQDDLLGKGKPGDLLRNLLVTAHETTTAWAELCDSIRHLFGYELLSPNAQGPHIIAEYRGASDGPPFDIASAGSGFQQVLMLLAFLHTRENATLLLDEPDAHLHVILQDAIYSELRSVAAQKNSQLVVATHSEIVINSVDADELCMVLGQPQLIADVAEKRRLVQALKVLSHVDIMCALQMDGVLYTEDYTDIYILKAWAKVLEHPVYDAFDKRILCREQQTITRPDAAGVGYDKHYDATRLVKDELPGLVLLDRDGNAHLPEDEITGTGMQRKRWSRYEIESYLVHPEVVDKLDQIQRAFNL